MSSIWIIERRIIAGNNFDGGAGEASGSIDVVAESNLALNEDYFELVDADGITVRFDFVDMAGLLKHPTTDIRRPVLIQSGDSATLVRDAVIVAINNAEGCGFYAGVVDADTLSIFARRGGSAGNRAQPADNVANGGFAINDPSGGTNHAYYDSDGVRVYLPRADGGQFDFPGITPRAIDGMPGKSPALTWEARVLIDAGNATGHEVRGVLPSGSHVVLASGTSGVNLYEGVVLDRDMRLQITSSGATNALFCRVQGSPKGLRPNVSTRF